jgi:hypothetical protein
MSGQAHVASISALDDFRAKLIVYLSKAGRVLDDVRQEVVGTRIWLQTDRQLHWKHELKRRNQVLAQAQQELLSARLSGHPSVVQDRRMAVQRARAAVDAAEQRFTRVKTWLRRYDTQVESKLKAVTQLRQILTQDMKKAIAVLDGSGRILAEYADLAPGRSVSPRSESEAQGATEDSAASSGHPEDPTQERNRTL